MADPKTQAQAASDLAAFLTTSQRGYASTGKTPLEEMLETQITQMTREIAAQVIADTPELRVHVRRMVELTVRRALADDPWLNQTVVAAVAKAVTDVAIERQREDDDA